jgi:outer membrane protein
VKMTALRKGLALALCGIAAGPAGIAQQVQIEPERPHDRIIRRPYEPVTAPPVRLADSDRLRGLVRGGKLYLTAQDAIALALENNIDIEVARYQPVELAWRLERSQAGGALPGVQGAAGNASQVASGQGVLGSQAAAGVNVNSNGGASRGTGNATVTQIGPVTQTYDPLIQASASFSHRSSPQANVIQTITTNLVQNQRNYAGSYQQGFSTGGSATVSYNDHYLNENAPTDVLNPSVAPSLAISLQQNLLQGRGVALNTRNITVAKMNLDTSDLGFRTQVTNTVVAVLQSYYALVVDYDGLSAKRSALETAQKFLDESRRRVELGALAPVDLIPAETQLEQSQLDLDNTQAEIAQDEVQLKSLISRTGGADRVLAGVQIVPLDQLAIPEKDDIGPLKDLVEKARRNRSDLLAQNEAIEAAKISALGTANGLLPTAQLFVGASQAGLAGSPRVANGLTANAYFDGGMGTALGQIFRRNFPTQNIGVFARATLNNGQAQADFGIDQLQLRQQQLNAAKSANQVEVELLNAVVALQQARARHEAAVGNRVLQEQLLDAEQKKFALGASTAYNVTQQQRDLANAQAAAISALAGYESARIELDRTTGATLEANRISLDEAKSGKVARASALPAENQP